MISRKSWVMRCSVSEPRWRARSRAPAVGSARCLPMFQVASWFDWGFVTYADEVKRGELDVPKEALSEHGAVSEPVVAVMAQKALERSGAEYAVAVSGIAGPDGGTEDKSVGTVWFAWGGRQMIRTECCRFAGNREFVRRQSVARALEGLLAIVGEDV